MEVLETAAGGSEGVGEYLFPKCCVSGCATNPGKCFSFAECPVWLETRRGRETELRDVYERYAANCALQLALVCGGCRCFHDGLGCVAVLKPVALAKRISFSRAGGGYLVYGFILGGVGLGV